MHIINRILSGFGLHLSRISPKRSATKDFIRSYKKSIQQLKKNPYGIKVYDSEFYCDIGKHPETYKDKECGFASHHMMALNPQKVLDIGSYRYFIIGLLSYFSVTTVGVRDRKPITANETVVTSDAKNLIFPDQTFDAVLSLSTIEHFGLGRYGDDFDLEADKKAFSEMKRVLKKGGHLIFTTTIAKEPSIVFNAHRIYSYSMIHSLCTGLQCVDERFYSLKSKKMCSVENITDKPACFDVYMGCWKKAL